MKTPIKQSITGIIRSKLAEYDLRKANGVKNIVFMEELIADGHKIKSVRVFTNLMVRARKKDLGKNEPVKELPPSNIKPEIKKEDIAKSQTSNVKSNTGALSPSQISDFLNNSDFDASKL